MRCHHRRCRRRVLTLLLLLLLSLLGTAAGQDHLHCPHSAAGKAAVPGNLRDSGLPEGIANQQLVSA